MVRRSLYPLILGVSGWALLSAGCLLDDTVEGTGGSPSGSKIAGTGQSESVQCRSDAECATFDTDADACTAAACVSNRCTQRLVRNTVDCQCHADKDCTYYEKACSSGVCENHRCIEKLAAEGPAPIAKQKAGDCQSLLCDGKSGNPIEKEDLADLPDDANPCTVDTCEATGVKHAALANGTACGAGGICFDGKCLTCVPRNATSCGTEGAGEPANDSSATPASFSEYTPFCAYSSGTDVDWYTFNAKDADFSHDVYNFHFWSTAPTIELCVYVRCGNGGTPGGGCSPLLPGPNGSQGCCWTGAPAALAPRWDLDCPNTTEDEGPTYLSVRTPGGDACEVYAMSGGY